MGDCGRRSRGRGHGRLLSTECGVVSRGLRRTGENGRWPPLAKD